MKNLLFFALFLLSVPTPSLAQNETGGLLKQLESKMAVVTAYNDKGTIVQRTIGLFINADGSVMVEAGLVAEGLRYEIKTPGGATFNMRDIFLDTFSPKVALLATEIPSGSFSPVSISSTPPKLNELLFALSLNDQINPQMSDGRVVGQKEYGVWENFIFLTTNPSVKSGIFLFNAKTEICGIVLWQHINLAELVVYPAKRITASVEGLLKTKNPVIERSQYQPALNEGEVQIANATALKRVKPKYPSEAISYGIRGKITLTITVDELGNVSDAQVKDVEITTPINTPEKKIESITEKLKKVAVEAAVKWKFSPAKSTERQLSVKGILIFNFIFQRS